MRHIRYFHRTILGKIFLSLLGIIMALALVLFTSWGNRLIAPLVEKSLTTSLSTPITVEEFTLTYNRFHLLFHDTKGNIFSTQGGFSLLTLRLYAHYRLSCFTHSGFNPLSSPFKTEGSLSGGISSLLIQGTGDIFRGNLLYKIELHQFHLASINLKIDKIYYQLLLQSFHYPSNTDTILTGKIDISGFDERSVEGSILLDSHTHRFVPTPIVSDNSDTNDSTTLKSLLADDYGKVKPFNVNVTVNASLDHAGILEQFVGMPLGGGLKLNATLSGDQKLLQLKAHSDVAHSEASVRVDIPNLEPSTIVFDLKHADLEQMFTLFALNAPISGESELYGELNTTVGNLNLIITKASTAPSVLLRDYHITQPLIRFDAEVHADLSKHGIHYRGAFKSDLSRMEIDNTTTHEQMLRDLLLSIPNGSPHR